VDGQDVELITCGLTSSEICAGKYCPGNGIHLKKQREAGFPLRVAKAALGFFVHKTEATNKEEERRLLECLAGLEEEGWQKMTRRLRSFFLLIFWQNVLAQATEEKSYMLMLSNMAKAIQGDWWRKSLSLNLSGCDMSKKAILDMALHSLPPGLEWLKLDLQFSGLDDPRLGPVAHALPRRLRGLVLNVSGNSVTDRGVVSFLAKLPPDLTQVTMKLQHTKVSPGLLELSKDGPSALQTWSNLASTERAEALKAKLEILERRKNPLAAPHPSQVSRKVALENLVCLAPTAIAEAVLKQVKSELALLERK